MALVYLGLGSNLGDSRGNLERAIAALEEVAEPGSLRRARFYRTAPIGPAGQPDYLNTAVELKTERPPHELLAFVKTLEQRLGRVPSERWGARAIDIDILIAGELELSTETLTIPHAELARRRFVLAPLLELAPELVVPRLGRTVRALYQALEDDPSGVRLEP